MINFTILFVMIVLLARECLKSFSPWYWMARRFPLEMGGGSNDRECKRKMCPCGAYEGEGVEF